MKKGSPNNLFVFVDGGARGNPGPAAIGVVIKDNHGRVMKSYGEAIGETTNNEAEYQAVIFALRKLKSLLGRSKTKMLSVEIKMDSELVSRQLKGEYKIEEEKLFPLFIKIWNLRMDFGEIRFANIPRNENKDADRLVNEALDRKLQRQLFS